MSSKNNLDNDERYCAENIESYGMMCMLLQIEHFISEGQFKSLDDIKVYASMLSKNISDELESKGFFPKKSARFSDPEEVAILLGWKQPS